jgi:predicted transcriptional regulator
MSVREVHAIVGRNLAYTSVMTVLSNLYHKGFLTRTVDGRAYRYAPVRSRESYSAELMSDALAASHNPHATLMHLVEHLSPEQTQVLGEILRQQAGAGSTSPTAQDDQKRDHLSRRDAAPGKRDSDRG